LALSLISVAGAAGKAGGRGYIARLSRAGALNLI